LLWSPPRRLGGGRARPTRLLQPRPRRHLRPRGRHRERRLDLQPGRRESHRRARRGAGGRALASAQPGPARRLGRGGAAGRGCRQLPGRPLPSRLLWDRCACTNDSWHSHAHKLESGRGRSLARARLLLPLRSRNSEWRARVAAEPARPPAILSRMWCSPRRDGAATRGGNSGRLRLGSPSSAPGSCASRREVR
jgi:hypothetical protein